MAWALLVPAMGAHPQDRPSLAGEAAARALKQSIAAEDYDLALGPLRVRTEAGLRLGYTDNVFYSATDRRADLLVNPEATLRGLWPIGDFNSLRLSLGLGYEWYLESTELNSDAPLVNPDSELVFHVFAGDFRFRFREKFSYEQSLFFNTSGEFYNVTDVGKFSRWNNRAGLEAVWDLNRTILTAGYDHENFMPETRSFEYLERASEWWDVSAAFPIGDQARVGLESRGALHDYRRESVLNDNWRLRGGPYFQLDSKQKISLRTGGGFELARSEAPGSGRDFEDYYAYLQVSQETRMFTHALTAGREHHLGFNADSLKTTRIGYSIASPVIRQLDIGADVSVNFAEEFGGAFREEFVYYRAALGIGWQFHKHWRTSLGYEFFLKSSDLPSRDFHRNRVTVELAWNH